MQTSRLGRFGLHFDRRPTNQAWFGFGRVAWLGTAVLALGPFAITVTWPVRYAQV
jgi:hypothetical protein